MGVYGFNESRRLTLLNLHPGVRVEHVLANREFEIVIPEDVGETQPPTPEERRILAELTDAGYLTQSHPSAGRAPTEQGYRVYVDALETSRQAPASVDDVFAGPRQEIDSLLSGTSELLSRLSNCVGLVSAPRWGCPECTPRSGWGGSATVGA